MEYIDLSLSFQLYAVIDITTQIHRVRDFSYNHCVDTQRAHSYFLPLRPPAPLCTLHLRLAWSGGLEYTVRQINKFCF